MNDPLLDFNQESFQINHLQFNLPTQQLESCPYCFEIFDTCKTLKDHCIQIHETEYVYMCIYCQKPNKRKSDYNRHIRSIHYKAKEFICCGHLPDGRLFGCMKSFSRKDHLLSHQRRKGAGECSFGLQE